MIGIWIIFPNKGTFFKTKNITMNILFLHGLESKLSPAKRVILEKYGNVIAPELDYKSNPNTIEFLYNTYQNQKIDVIIGSSMGGFVGYHLAHLLNLPCMLYNPALPYRNTIEQIVPSNILIHHPESMRIILGGQDDVIKAKDNLAFLAQNSSDKTDYTIVIRKELAHQIPIDVFEKETRTLFDSGILKINSEIHNYPPPTCCHSGGSIGADTDFERISSKYNITTIAYSYQTEENKAANKYELDEEEYLEGLLHVYKANETLKKIDLKPYLNLYARSWFLVKNAEQLFAISTFIQKGKRQFVKGGTGFSVQMAIDNKKEVFVFDQELNQWFYWDYFNKVFTQMDESPKIRTSNFAGTGTRDLNLCGRNAIEELFIPSKNVSKEEYEKIEDILKLL